MCDTFVALANATLDGSVIFGKNSDRDANEAHELVLIPHAFHPDGATLRCTYIDIPQVLETNAVLLAKPFWIWGAEMGANEHNVVIGNEAIFSKLPAGKKPGLIGMDFLRLALERADNAKAALDVITILLEEYGQSGNCGFVHPIYYHNSFLIVDPNEAWVLETVDRHWVAEKVKDVRSISNGMTIGSQYDLASHDLLQFALGKGWCKDASDFDFKACYSDVIMTFGSDSKNRQCRTMELLQANLGQVTVQTAMQVLRDHGESADENWSPDRGFMGATVCMHASAGPIRISQTTGSMVTYIKDGMATHWLTGTSAPCSGIFKPVWMDAGLPYMGTEPTGTYDKQSLWWRHEDLHRAILQDYAHRLRLYKADRDALEKGFIEAVEGLVSADEAEKLTLSENCFADAWQATEAWIARVNQAVPQKRQACLHKNIWKKLDRQSERT